MSDWKILRSDSLSRSTASNSKKNRQMIKNTPSLKFDELKKEGNVLYEEKIRKEDELISKVESGVITREDLVKKAENIKAARAEKAKKAAEKKAEKTA